MKNFFKKHNLEPPKKRFKKACRREPMLSFEEQKQKDAKFYQRYLKDHASRLEAEALSQQATNNLLPFGGNDLGVNNRADTGDGNREHAVHTRLASKQSMLQKWNAHSEELMEWYLKSLDLMGKPNLSRSQAIFMSVQCLCSDKKASTLTLYFLSNVQKVNVEHCSCSSLTKQLIINQLMPASFQLPLKAIDFGMLEYFHLLKTKARISDHCFAEISNKLYRKTGVLDVNATSLTQSFVSSVYHLHQKLLLSVQSHPQVLNRELSLIYWL
ncbi:hypothetical protein BD560DRAFT_388905 [Blakeslea trispora]|nr:hypothetical protein BD560DRAFT_388905 [Blakeslea trispora]